MKIFFNSVGIFLIFGGVGTIEYTGNLNPVDAFAGLVGGLTVAVFGSFLLITGLAMNEAEKKAPIKWEQKKRKKIFGQ